MNRHPTVWRYLFFQKIISELLLCFGVCNLSYGQDTLETSDLKLRPLEELMEIEVTSISKRSERAFQVPASVYVITQEDIRRSGVTSLPEALRLATNLNVAQIDARQFAISARGFNSSSANKLLVMIDGRSVYTPLYSGVFWDVQNIFLVDIERIEVISGPGVTLWGTNAVNGIINIITKQAGTYSSQGLTLKSSVGTQEQFFGGVRYGGSLSENCNFRVYGFNQNKNESFLTSGDGAGDSWLFKQGGFRVDYDEKVASRFTVQGDIYSGTIHQLVNDNVEVSGGNVLARWTKTFDARNSFTLQMYVDRTFRNIPLTFGEHLTAYDLDFQHNFPFGESHDIIWGVGFRYLHDQVTNSALLAFLPDFLAMRLYTGFIQDEISLFENNAKFIFGSKFEHNDFSGFEYQPSAKFLYSFTPRQVGWASITRAVRTPSRIDRDFFVYLPVPPYPLAGGPTFTSEKVVAYELGYRTQPTSPMKLELALFYNLYDDLRSVEPRSPSVLENGLEATSYGTEVMVNYQMSSWWQWRFGYSYLQKDVRLKPWSQDVNKGNAEGNDARHRFQLISQMDLLEGIELNTWLRIVDELPNSNAGVPGYAELDVRLGFNFTPKFSLSIVGQNLLHSKHVEFASSTVRREIPRSMYVSLNLDL